MGFESKRWFYISVLGTMLGGLSFGDDSSRGDQAVSDAMRALGAVEASTSFLAEGEAGRLLLAKKKKGRNNKNRRRPPTSKKTTASVGNRRHMDEESRNRMDMLGQSNDLDPAVIAERSKLRIDRFVTEQSKQKRFIEGVKTRVFKGGDINATDASGQTYLHKAVLSGYGDAVDFLLKHGANKHIKDSTGKTPKALAEHIKQFKIAAKFHR